MLDIDKSIVVAIDLQEKLIDMTGKYSPVDNSLKIIRAANTLDIPVLITEQYPKGLGSTVAEIKDNCSASYIEKTTFSAYRTDDFAKAIKDTGKSQIVIFGIEAHICVYQTIYDLIDAGYEVYFIKDCSASRNKFEFKTGVDLIRQIGAKVTCTEIVLFEWLKTSKHPNFKEIQALIK